VINLIAEIVHFQDSSQSNGSGTGKKNMRPGPSEPDLESVESNEQSEVAFNSKQVFWFAICWPARGVESSRLPRYNAVD
jgi:hypothetical protein